MTHYICTGGCKGVSDTPAMCQVEGCGNYGKPLKECNCEDNTHKPAEEEQKATE